MICAEQDFCSLTPAQYSLGGLALHTPHQLQGVVHVKEGEILVRAGNCYPVVLLDVLRAKRRLGEVSDFKVGLHIWAAQFQASASLLHEGNFVIAFQVDDLFTVGLMSIAVLQGRLAEANDVVLLRHILRHALIHQESGELLPSHATITIHVDGVEKIDQLRDDLPFLFVEFKESDELKDLLELALHDDHKALQVDIALLLEDRLQGRDLFQVYHTQNLCQIKARDHVGHHALLQQELGKDFPGQQLLCFLLHLGFRHESGVHEVILLFDLFDFLLLFAFHTLSDGFVHQLQGRDHLFLPALHTSHSGQ
mmetsp:Transcript_54859/g.111482  ORF Transcript_54859/g.111482 Transcript_54859/m.111482 type:complete len:309 (+) Transcript_54859:2250-3176(+)